jgi:hypothetical protein
MTADVLHKIYDILVEMGGADEHMRDAFISYFTGSGHSREWRFSGKLGYGGKFWYRDYLDHQITVNCYPEDMTQERSTLIDQMNEALAKIKVK